MRRWHVVGLVMFAAAALLPTASAYAIDAYVRWSTRAFFQREAPVTATLTLSSGRLLIEGTRVLYTGPEPSGAFLWHARYRPANAASPGADEFVGSWQARKNGTRAYTVGSLVVVIPGDDSAIDSVNRVFVRTVRGTWHETRLNFRDLTDGIDPPELTAALTSIGVDDLRTITAALGPRDRLQLASCWIESFSAERSELIVYYEAPPSMAGRLHLALSAEGDAWRLTGIGPGGGAVRP